jgi:hypothetical protein
MTSKTRNLLTMFRGSVGRGTPEIPDRATLHASLGHERTEPASAELLIACSGTTRHCLGAGALGFSGGQRGQQKKRDEQNGKKRAFQRHRSYLSN